MASQRAEGEVHGEGSFTLAREKALAKLANFQLPFEGAWAVKVIQAALLVGTGPISLRQTSKETVFFFQPDPDWTIDGLEEAFFELEKHTVSLRCLMSALWVTGVGRGCPFLITLPGHQEGLVWNGQEFYRLSQDDNENQSRDCDRSDSNLCLRVFHFPAGRTGVVDWVQQQVSGSRLNAEVSKAVCQLCFASSRELRLDGRRIDGFQFAPEQGWSESSFPLWLSPVPCSLPPLEIPPGTSSGLRGEDLFVNNIKGMDRVAEKALGGLDLAEETGAMLMVTAHAMRAKSGRRTTWETHSGRCLVYWIRHGIVLRAEPLSIPARCCSIALFLNAQGLKTDLSGLLLQRDDQAVERLRVALKAGDRALQSLDMTILDILVDSVRKRKKVVAGAMAVVGGGLLMATSQIQFGALIIAGGMTAYNAGNEEKQLIEEYREALLGLRLDWRRLSDSPAGL